MDLQKFLNFPYKSITLMGMSGVGKSHLSARMEEWGWSVYSCDVEIAKKLIGGDVTIDDIGKLSQFVGQLGKGAFDLEKFNDRQKCYGEAECEALKNISSAISEAYEHRQHFVNDSTGSLCEIQDKQLLNQIGDQTLIVYIESTDTEKRELLDRAEKYPKPLYFPPDMFKIWCGQYIEEKKISSIDDTNPDVFSRWVFPKLLESRLSKYERIAKKRGVIIPSMELRNVSSEQGFLGIVTRNFGAIPNFAPSNLTNS